MIVEYQEDCNGAANRTAVTGHIKWMLYLEYMSVAILFLTK